MSNAIYYICKYFKCYCYSKYCHIYLILQFLVKVLDPLEISSLER